MTDPHSHSIRLDVWDLHTQASARAAISFPCTLEHPNGYNPAAITFTITALPDPTVEDLVTEALDTDGAHHKQWFLERIADLLGIENEHEGIAP